MPEALSTSSTDDVLLFTAAGERLALLASDIVEIIRPPVTTRVPHSPADLLGVANLRGTVLPILSLNGLLGGKTTPASQSARVIVVKGRTPVGLLVDAVTALTKSSDGKRIDLKALLDKNFRLPSRPPRNRSVATDDADVARDEVHEELVFLCFHLANQEYALPLDQIVSVAALPDVVAGLPRTDQAMIGVAEIEGSLVPLVSARVLLGFPNHEGNREKDRIIVTRLGGASVALVVDGVKAILRARPDALDPVPRFSRAPRARRRSKSICRLDGGRRLISILAPAKLFDAETTKRVLAEAKLEAPQMSNGQTQMQDAEQFIIFQLGEEFYGLPIGSVDEIVRCPDNLTRVPRAPGFVRGLMNLRGKAVPIIDQRQRFSVPGGKDSSRRRIVVVTIDGLQAGFLVDTVSEVLSVSTRELSPAPELAADADPVVDRIAMIEREGHMILLVNPKALLDRAERDLLNDIASGTGDAPRS